MMNATTNAKLIEKFTAERSRHRAALLTFQNLVNRVDTQAGLCEWEAPLRFLEDTDAVWAAAGRVEVLGICLDLLDVSHGPEFLLRYAEEQLLHLVRVMGTGRSTSALTNLAADVRAQAWGEVIEKMGGRR